MIVLLWLDKWGAVSRAANFVLYQLSYIPAYARMVGFEPTTSALNVRVSYPVTALNFFFPSW